MFEKNELSLRAPARAYRWCVARPRLLLTLAVVAVLAPFLGKAFNIDDPLFLWAARQIQAHPTNPYGFEVNWYGSLTPMWEVTKNPPLACYYLAAAAAILGWSEVALHAAFMLPAVAVILGSYRLARRWCERPAMAAGVALFTPVFLISSTTVMCDVLTLAFWVWAVVLWEEGLERGSTGRLVGAAVLVAMSALSKYFGICLIPLLVVYTLIRQRKLGLWVLILLIPVAILAGYQWATHALYGKGLLSDAAGYASSIRQDSGVSKLSAAIQSLSFTGGCLAVAALLTPWLWRPRVLIGFLLFGGVVAFEIFRRHALPGLDGLEARRLLGAQIVLWVVGGASILALAAEALWRWRDAPSFLLGSWIVGTFLFAGFVNWTVNGRSILPMVPAVSILLVRRLSRSDSEAREVHRWGVRIALVAGAILAVAVTRGDYLQASAIRESARQTYAKLGPENGTLWSSAHWGFQYYIEKLGSKTRTLVKEQWQPHEGDLLVNAINNDRVWPRDPQVDSMETLTIDGTRWLTTFQSEVGAGFYASVWGPLPFAFAKVPAEGVTIHHLNSLREATITLVSTDRSDLQCAASGNVKGFVCGFTADLVAAPRNEGITLQPVYTSEHHLFLVAGLFLDPAIQARFRTEPTDKPREQLKRFSAKCDLRVIGAMPGTRTRWLPHGEWTPAEDAEVALISNCKIDG